MARLLTALCLALCFTIASCEKKEVTNTYDYVVTNTCDTTISVLVKQGIDMIFYIPSGGTEKIYTTSRTEPADLGPAFREIYYEFDSIIVKKRDTLSSENYMRDEKWTFTRTADGRGLYTAIVYQSEF